MELKSGSRWKSAVCETEIVVVRTAAGGPRLECGGHPMAPDGELRPEGLTMNPDQAGGTALGKRFRDIDSGLEVLCVKRGQGTLALGGRALTEKDAKQLPSSD